MHVLYEELVVCIVVSPERTGGATVKELSSPDGEWEGGEKMEIRESMLWIIIYVHDECV